MTPAIRLLKKQNIAHSVHEYEHDPSNSNFGLEACEKLGLSADEVFKTLLTTDSKQYFVAILPVQNTLNLKKMASVVGVKKLSMANPNDAERITGYIVGGISPIAQKRRLKTVIHTNAEQLDKMYVSGGRRGLDVGLAPDDLAQLLPAGFVDIVDD
ncbi:MAG: Cys-tRNA(Pro) deacylase [Moraxella sp.]|nr:Cys-tRNA(Pro) deacylase [Moraxella sp.]